MATSFLTLVKRFARDDRGATLVEYSILIALVTVALVGAIAAMGGQIQTAFDRIVAVLTTSNGG